MFVSAFTVVALAACSRGGEKGIDEQPVTDVGQAGVGKCLRFSDTVGEEVTELPFTSCTDPHTHEIFAIFTNGDDVYPGFDALDATALTECVGAFEGYIGISPFDSTLVYSWLVPTLDGWNREDDRETICVVASGDGSTLESSLADSNL